MKGATYFCSQKSLARGVLPDVLGINVLEGVGVLGRGRGKTKICATQIYRVNAKKTPVNVNENTCKPVGVAKVVQPRNISHPLIISSILSPIWFAITPV